MKKNIRDGLSIKSMSLHDSIYIYIYCILVVFMFRSLKIVSFLNQSLHILSLHVRSFHNGARSMSSR